MDKFIFVFLISFASLFAQIGKDGINTSGLDIGKPGITLASVSGGGGSYEPEASALFARMTPEPDDTRKGHINTLIKSLKDDGVWSGLDALYIYAAHSQAPALLNWVEDDNNCTAVNSPTFTTDRGFAGNGTSSYVNTNYNPTNDANNYTASSASIMLYIRTADLANDTPMGMENGMADKTKINILKSVNQISNYVNGSTALSSSNNATDGTYHVVRRISPNLQFYKNGSSVNSGVSTLRDPPNVNCYVCCYNDDGTAKAFSTKQIAAASLGGELTSTEVSNFNTATEVYMDAVGAGVQ